VWAFAAIPRPGPVKEHYERRRAHGDKHAAALCHLFNRLLGQLYHCLQSGQIYDLAKSFGCAPLTATGVTAAGTGARTQCG
jgi:hypothetical protein